MTTQILRYHLSSQSTNLRHWTVRAVALVDGKEVDSGKTYFKGIKRDCRAFTLKANARLKQLAIHSAIASGTHIGRLP